MDPDDLLVQFQSITTNDHESLILQFSNLLKLDKNAAIFYLESSNWNVETAINHCLSNESAALLQSSIENNTMVQSMPQAKLTNDLSDVQQASFSPLEKVQMVVYAVKNCLYTKLLGMDILQYGGRALASRYAY